MAKNVLLVDDNLEELEMLSTALKKQGFRIHPAYTADDASEILKTEEIDALLLDMDLPSNGGEYLLTYAKKMIKYRNLPIISAIANDNDEMKARLIELGASEFITKPINTEELFGVLGKFLKMQAVKAATAQRKLSHGLSVLVVDDEVDITDLLREFLKTKFKTVHVANNVEEAQRICLSVQVDLIISDIKMPDKSGFDLVIWLNMQPSIAAIPVIMITGVKKDIESVKKAKDLWIDKYLIKPFDLQKISAFVDEVTSRTYRINKLKKFMTQVTHLYKLAHEEENAMLKSIRRDVLVTKTDLNALIRQRKLMPSNAPAKDRFVLEEKVKEKENKAKVSQDEMSSIKKQYYEKRKLYVSLKRQLHQRLEAFK